MNSLAKYVSIIYRHGQSHLSKKLESLHIGSGQYVYLIHVARHPGINQEALSEYVKIDKATTAKAIKRLMEIGYIERRTDPLDLRSYQVFLTDKGKEILPILKKWVQEWEDYMIHGLSQDEIKQLIPLFEKVANNATHLTHMEEQHEKNLL